MLSNVFSLRVGSESHTSQRISNFLLKLQGGEKLIKTHLKLNKLLKSNSSLWRRRIFFFILLSRISRPHRTSFVFQQLALRDSQKNGLIVFHIKMSLYSVLIAHLGFFSWIASYMYIFKWIKNIVTSKVETISKLSLNGDLF